MCCFKLVADKSVTKLPILLKNTTFSNITKYAGTSSDYTNNTILEGNMLYLRPDKKARQVIVGPRAEGPRANNDLEGLFEGP